MGDQQVKRCECGSCRTGSLVPGHCRDIDGDWWHDCAANDRQDRQDVERERVRQAQAAFRAEVNDRG